MIDAVTLDGKHALLQLDRIATVLDSQEAGTIVVCPDPRSARQKAVLGVLDEADLLVETPNEPLAALNGDIDSLWLLGGNELELHDHISLLM